MTAKTILIIGGTSDISLALARRYAALGQHLILTARDVSKLDADMADARVRGAASARAVAFDLLQTEQYGAFIDSLGVLPDTIVCMAGIMSDQPAAQRDGALAEAMMVTNYVGPVLLLGAFANRMEQRGSGCIVGVSSVAGDRGRYSNYIYGSSKAGFTAFLAGLRARMARANVHVMTVKPGFINTRMVAHMTPPPLITAQPDDVAAAIIRGVDARSNVIYVLKRWRWIMMIVTHIPECIAKKLGW
ncbi:MAG: short-chain dehydrogenase [Hyphomonas sp. 32-62-5]|nr:MAG: short-chain dehydrogenase [Hyphomonas sp. 32-62-5]